ncbi:spermatogenesis-associated protein 31E1 [Bos taurus]|uniref:spermatogenesis-associated protein 31E1 n=1 Tax=Bos taurus TaxID=9913 RepID=UPI000572DDC4|nr:spermatogenesis-associated protein 31E1 [Bos taurus]
MMETLFGSLKSTFGPWLDSDSTSWVTETILVTLFGLGLFFLFFPYFQNKPTLPPLRKHRNTRKHQMQPSGRCRDRKTDRALKACRDCLKELEEVRDLASHLQRHLGRTTDKGTIHQLSSQETPGEPCLGGRGLPKPEVSLPWHT